MSETKKINIEELQQKIDKLELLNNVLSFGSMRNLSLTAMDTSSRINTVTRNNEYLERLEMYSDVLVRELVKVIIIRAIGTTHDNIKPFTIRLKENNKINEKIKKKITDEFEYLTNLIDKNLLDVTLDSQFYGDGYVKIEFEKGKGVTKLLRNISTTPLNITPIVTNKDNLVAYEVGSILNMYQNKNKIVKEVNSKSYVAPLNIVRMNSKGNGIVPITQEQIVDIEKMNVFADEEYAFEDGIYGGVMENVYPKYKKFKWAIKSLSNTRIASSVLERFILHNLSGVSDEEKKVLKTALENEIKTTLNNINNKIDTTNPDIMIANHIIPVTGDNTNNVSIQESNPQFTNLNTIDDIMIHIRDFLGAIGINIEMTSFAGMSIGGNEKDGVVQNSLQMDGQGTQIRRAIREYVLDIIRIHFLAKYSLEIDLSQIEVDFVSVLNEAKITAENQRLEAIQNTQQILAMIDQIKQQGYEDTPENREAMKDLLNDLISENTRNRELQLNMFVNLIFKKPENNENGEM